MKTEIGKIRQLDLNEVGHVDLHLGGKGWGVHIGASVADMCKHMETAECTRLQAMVNVPIEATFSGVILKEWRVLTEAL